MAGCLSAFYLVLNVCVWILYHVVHEYLGRLIAWNVTRVGCRIMCVKVCVCNCGTEGGTTSSRYPLKLGHQPTLPAKHWSWRGWSNDPDGCRQYAPSLHINPILHSTDWDRSWSHEVIGGNESWISAARCQWISSFHWHWWSDGLRPAAEHERLQRPTIGSGDRSSETICTTVLEQPTCPTSQFNIHYCSSTIVHTLVLSYLRLYVIPKTSSPK